MKIAINTLSENPNAPSGAFGYYQNLIRELDGLIGDDTLYVFVSRKSKNHFGPYHSPNMKKIVFRHSNESKWMRILTEHFIFPFVLMKYKIDVLNTGTSILYSPSKLIATLKTMHVYTNPGSIGRLTRLYRKAMYLLTKNKAKAIISNSDSQTSDIIRYLDIDKSKIQLVYEALDHKVFMPVKTIGQNQEFLNTYGINKPYILFVSSLYRYKNAEALIHAYTDLARSKDFQLVFVGFPREPEYYADLQKLIKKKEIEDLTIFTGGVPLSETARFYQSATMFVYPSRYETFGLTVLEAMACGCPVITSNISAMPEIGGNAAMYFDPDDKKALLDTMDLLLENREKRDKMIALGLKRSNEFTWKKTAENTLAVFRKQNNN
jgi:glycosyltransferase involved in cell wall biosynthesis